VKVKRNKIRSLETDDFYLNLIKEKTSKLFLNKKEVELHLQKEVFNRVEFQNNVDEVSKTLGISNELAKTIITNYLIDILYEIDIAQSLLRKKTRIIIPSYLMFDIGFIYPLRGKTFYLRRFMRAYKKEQKLINTKY